MTGRVKLISHIKNLTRHHIMKRKPEKRERKGEGGISWWAADVAWRERGGGRGKGKGNG